MPNKIPKKIHYIWIGNKKIPRSVQKRIKTWQQILNGYEFVFWNEDNFPLMNHHYISYMYNAKKWAFVSDYMRFWILYKYGGIYLDTDMEVFRAFDDLLGDECFFGYADNGLVNCGIVGSVSNHEFLRSVLEFYDNNKEYSVKNTSPAIVTNLLSNGKYSVSIYDSSYFYPCNDNAKCDKVRKENAYTNHLWTGSWKPFIRIRKIIYKIGIYRVLKYIYRTLINYVVKK